MSPAATAEALVVELDYEKDTKRTQRFESPDEDAAVGQLYITKEGLEKLGNPRRVRVTIEAA